MINKTKLVDFIEKYYLNGLTKSVIYTIKNKILSVGFGTESSDLAGTIESSIDLEDGEFGVLETPPFLKLLNILDTDIQIDYQSEYNIIEKLLIEDNQYKMTFTLADTATVAEPPTVNEVEFDLTYDIEPDFPTKFIECKKALGPGITTFKIIVEEDNKAKIILGDPSGHSNKLEFEIDVKYEGFPFDLILNSDYVKEILAANKNYDSGELKINSGGLLHFCFTEGDTISKYNVLALNNQSSSF